jgi:ribosomal protein L37AE/L43A
MTCKCTAETPDGIYLCHACCARLEQLLCELDSIVQDLVTAIPRASLTASYGERVSSSGSLHAPLPVNEVALDAHMALDKYLMRVCLELAGVAGPLSRRDSSGLASYLLTHMGTLRTQDWARTVEGELSKLLRECEDVTRVHEQQVFAGTCQECETDLYARKGEDMARCRTCGLSYEVARWTAYAQTAKDYYIGTAADLSRKLSAPQYGYLITADQIRKWATKRGEKDPKLVRANPEQDEDGKPIPPAYRLGDVLGLRIERYKQFPINGAA